MTRCVRAGLEAEARRRGFTPLELARWLSEAPAKLAGLARKGSLEAGKDADLLVWEPDAPGISDRSYHRHPGSIYTAKAGLLGRVRQTLVRGRVAYANDGVGDQGHGPPCGRMLLRERGGAGAP